MNKLIATLALCGIIGTAMAQDQNVAEVIPAQNVGGKTEFEHVFQTQLQYPDELLKNKVSENVDVIYSIDAKGTVLSVHVKPAQNKAFEAEALRIGRLFEFTPAAKEGIAIASLTGLTFKFNAETYKKICKSRGFVKNEYPKEQPDTSIVVYERADASPQYYKGDEALAEFILKELDYPSLAVHQNVEGTVVLNFVVEPNGRVSNVKILKGVNAGCSEEAIRVLHLTRWIPGKKDGKLVRYRMTYPIVFNLKNISQDNSGGQR